MKKVLVALAVVFALCGLVVFLAFQQTVAEHFGYALPGGIGLPHRLNYAGRDYESEEPSACTSLAWFREYHYVPLQRVGSLPTLFGSPHPIFRAPTPHGMTTMGLFIPLTTGCFAAYSLLGGP